MAALFNFEVHTPYRLFFSGMAEVITLTLADGDIGVYAHHSPFIAPSVTCILRIKDWKGNWRNAFVAAGILEVKDHKNVLIVDAAEWPEEIDRERALKSKQEAEKNLSVAHLKFQVDHEKAKLRRAEYRLKVLDGKV
ncbi:MAG: ATP synthase F1 subunit epsilon [Treponema sp.]|jgi:F-type H+-transporting ATPase subunit epsilon|nr:ATP synthase F1 subunit epsilon [Treponema sp.]